MEHAPAVIRQHDGPDGRWTLARRRPAPALAAFVIQYTGFRESGGRPAVRTELPTARVPLIIDFGPGFTLSDSAAPGGWRALGSFVAGFDDRPALVGSHGEAFCLQVDFTLPGARRFLGLPLAELAHQVVDLALLLGAEAGRLAERLEEAPGWHARFDLLDDLLARRLLGSTQTAPPPPPLFETAWSALADSTGALGVGALAARLDCSRKHLDQLFRREAGLPPKTMARILRFERALERLQEGSAGSLAELAVACGYYDQAHFNRDFRAFAGTSPTALASNLPAAAPDASAPA